MLASWWGGASSLCDVLDILQRNMVSDGGNNTEKWPLEILFHVLTSDSPGSHIQNFTIGLSIGFGTTLTAFLFCYAAIKLERIAMLPAHPELAKRLLKCLRSG